MLNRIWLKKKFVPAGAALITGVIFLLMWVLLIKTPAYMVYIDGQEKFAIKSTEEVNNKIKEIKLLEEQKVNHDLEIDNKVVFKRVFVGKDSIISSEQLEKELKKNIEFKTTAEAIIVDGKTIACLKCKEAAEQILKDLKEEYSQVDEGEKLLELSFVENVEIKEEKVAVNDIISSQEAYELITTGTKSPKKYVVQEGDSLWLIARRNGMYVDDIIRANKLKAEKILPGQELIVAKSKPYISVIAKVEGEKIENIPYETKVIVDKNSTSSIRVKQAGKDGKKQIEYIATRLNGVLEKREITQEKILSSAIDRIIVKGTQVTQVASRGGGSGTLDWPVYGPITQYYKGSRHTGLDIGGKTGTLIKAADSGYVTFAGWLGGYGKFIVVDHGNGIVTRYAHCTSFIASVGQKVSRGEAIARLGSTGNSTGPHLHFEVLAYGAFQNPLNYLR